MGASGIGHHAPGRIDRTIADSKLAPRRDVRFHDVHPITQVKLRRNRGVFSGFSASSKRKIRLVMPIPRVLFIAAIAGICSFGQTPPCGRAVVTVGGAAREERFLPAAPAHVGASVRLALPVVAAKRTKESESRMEAKTDGELFRTLRQRNKEAGVGGIIHRGTGALGTFMIEYQAATENGIAGTRLTIEFHKNAFRGRVGSSEQATPLMDEAVCLAKILSPSDPEKFPRGAAEKAGTGETREVTVPEGTPLKVLLRNFLYSKKIKPNQPIVLEVAEDVAVDGFVVVRRGALASARFTDAKSARGYRRAGELAFVIDRVTAVDGQAISVSAAAEKSRGAQKETKLKRVMTLSPALGWLDKGVETVV